MFSRRSLTEDESDQPNPWTRGGERPVDTLNAPPATRPPPVTQPRDLGTLKEAESRLLDVRVDAKIVRDGRGGQTGAVTSFSRVGSTSPGYVTDAEGNITRFNGKFRWRGTITIQTRYASDSRPDDPSCYGRGTTVADRQSGQITLGFHESCHRADYVAYLQGHPLPDPPALAIGMAEAAYQQETARFQQEVEAYWNEMEQDSDRRTDEVGHTKSEVDRTGNCYTHVVP